MVLIDAHFPVPQPDERVQKITGDISDRDVIESADSITSLSLMSPVIF